MVRIKNVTTELLPLHHSRVKDVERRLINNMGKNDSIRRGKLLVGNEDGLAVKSVIASYRSVTHRGTVSCLPELVFWATNFDVEHTYCARSVFKFSKTQPCP